MPDMNAPGYSRYPGQTGLRRRDNAIANVKRGGPAYQNAVSILRTEYGYTQADILRIRKGN